MAYKTFADQVHDHLTFLRSRGFDVDELKEGAGFVRCRSAGKSQGRGELCYKTTLTMLANGLVGLMTWSRAAEGVETFKTYGLARDGSELGIGASAPVTPVASGGGGASHEAAARKAHGFWEYSDTQGESDYLKRKGVGAYGIRYRPSAKYGNVAVVPMRDIEGRLWSYQLLNPDGTKRFPKGARTRGLFHCLRPVINGKPLGVAESYATAATCMENTGIPCICCFSCNNIKDVVVSLAARYPDNPIIIFADNDRHLEIDPITHNGNQGLLEARGARDVVGCGIVVAPDFGGFGVSKEASDWNDLFRLKGGGEVRLQLTGVTSLFTEGAKGFEELAVSVLGV